MSDFQLMTTVKATYQPQGDQSFRCSGNIENWHAPENYVIQVKITAPEGYPSPYFTIKRDKSWASDSTWYQDLHDGFEFNPDYDNGDPVADTAGDLYIGTTTGLPEGLDGSAEYTVEFYIKDRYASEPDPVELDAAQKLNMMRTYAPCIYLAKEEAYFPSTVEFFFEHTERFKNEDDDDKYWVRSKDSLDSPSAVLPFFSGDLDNAKLYAYWVKKKDNVQQATYFAFYPYNRGKEVLDTIWGNHVGDWEHITVRFKPEEKDGSTSLVPFEVYLSAHDGGATKPWSEVKKHDDSQQPIVFSAAGSHANYFFAGDHTYHTDPDLVDKCSEGTLWDTKEHLVAFDWESKSGLQDNDWPAWMGEDFTEGGDEPSNPASGAIYRWGNPKDGCTGEFISGECRLNDGPTGPVSKEEVWNPDTFE